MNTRMSFMEKYGWNGILPQFDTIPWGLLEPDSWRQVGWRNVHL